MIEQVDNEFFAPTRPDVQAEPEPAAIERRSYNFSGQIEREAVEVQTSDPLVLAARASQDLLAESGDRSVDRVFLNGEAVSLDAASALPTDPGYTGAQWNLNGPHGINVAGAWADYTGKGVIVGVVDEGIDYNHPELKANYRFDLDWDFQSNDDDALAVKVDAEEHGTATMGMIGAAADGVGTVGVAHDADLFGVRINFGVGGTSSAGKNAAVGYALKHADVVNDSWGSTVAFGDTFGATSVMASNFLDGAMNGRDGLGTTNVWAAGNYRSNNDNVNYHNYLNSQYAIAVAATTSTGKFASFSTPGAAVLVSAPGSSVQTTDRLGSEGYGSKDYTSVSGTSFSSPTVAGVAALMYEANDELGYRDVQQILSYSARLTDAASLGWKTNGATDWNGGGLHFSHDYGFGMVDATAAVRLAETWTAQSTYHNLITKTATTVGAATAAAPDLGSVVLTKSIAVPDNIAIDKAVITIEVAGKVSDMVVTLISPSGTEAVLWANPKNTATSKTFTMTANNFWGEDAAGEWKLTIKDTVANSIGVTLKSWTLQVIGDEASNDLYVYTNEYTGVAGKNILTDTAGKDGINAAAVTTASVIDLNGGAGNIGGKAFAVKADTVVENVWTGDGNDAVTGNAADNYLSGGRGNDTLSGGTGMDTLVGGLGNDSLIGGYGADTALIDGLSSDYSWNKTGDGFLLSGEQGLDFLTGIETLRFTDKAVTLEVAPPPPPVSVVLNGTAGADKLVGTTGNDTLTGANGNDTLEGGDGNDLLRGNVGIDRYIGGNGIDTVSYADAGKASWSTTAASVKFVGTGVEVALAQLGSKAGAFVARGDATGESFIGVENLVGSQYDDLLRGDNNANRLDGGAGNDYLLGYGGLDTIDGGAGNDIIFGGTYGYEANKVVYNDLGGNVLRGGDGNDQITGDTRGQGVDRIWGGNGKDSLYGAAGDDIFVITDTAGDNASADLGDDDFFVFHQNGSSGKAAVIGTLQGDTGFDQVFVQEMDDWSGFKLGSRTGDVYNIAKIGGASLTLTNIHDGSRIIMHGVEQISQIDPTVHAASYDFINQDYLIA